MPFLSIVGGGIIGSLAFRAGNAVGSSINLSDQQRKDRERREKAYRDATNARRRKRYAEKRAEAEAAALAEAQGGVLIMTNEATDQDVIGAPTKTNRKARPKSAVPLVQATTFAEPVRHDPITAALMQKLGLEGLRDMNYLGAWLVSHRRPNPDDNHPDKSIVIAYDDIEAFFGMLGLAGLSEEEARAERLNFERVGDPLTLADMLEARGFGKFKAETVEVLLPFNRATWGLKGA